MTFIKPTEPRHWQPYSKEELAYVQSVYKRKTDRQIGRDIKRSAKAISQLRHQRGWKKDRTKRAIKSIVVIPRKLGLIRSFINWIW